MSWCCCFCYSKGKHISFPTASVQPPKLIFKINTVHDICYLSKRQGRLSPFKGWLKKTYWYRPKHSKTGLFVCVCILLFLSTCCQHSLVVKKVAWNSQLIWKSWFSMYRGIVRQGITKSYANFSIYSCDRHVRHLCLILQHTGCWSASLMITLLCLISNLVN